MVEGIAAVVVQIGIAIVQGVIDISAVVLVASIRPWRYVFSPRFREKTNQQLQGRSSFYKRWHLFWGSIALLVSLAIVSTSLWFFIFMRPATPEPTAKEKALHELERAVVEHFTKRKNNN